MCKYNTNLCHIYKDCYECSVEKGFCHEYQCYMCYGDEEDEDQNCHRQECKNIKFEETR